MALRYLTAGESHGPGALRHRRGLPGRPRRSTSRRVDAELARRQKGYGRGGRMQIETDRAQFLSGIRGGVTLGTPIALVVWNKDHENWKDLMSPDGARRAALHPAAPRPRRPARRRSSTASTTPATRSSGPAPAPPPPRWRSGRWPASSSAASASRSRSRVTAIGERSDPRRRAAHGRRSGPPSRPPTSARRRPGAGRGVARHRRPGEGARRLHRRRLRGLGHRAAARPRHLRPPRPPARRAARRRALRHPGHPRRWRSARAPGWTCPGDRFHDAIQHSAGARLPPGHQPGRRHRGRHDQRRAALRAGLHEAHPHHDHAARHGGHRHPRAGPGPLRAQRRLRRAGRRGGGRGGGLLGARRASSSRSSAATPSVDIEKAVEAYAARIR